MSDQKLPEQPHGPGAICDECGHLAYRHNESGCDISDIIKIGLRTDPCSCSGMLWLGVRWPRPWLPAPEGLTVGIDGIENLKEDEPDKTAFFNQERKCPNCDETMRQSLELNAYLCDGCGYKETT